MVSAARLVVLLLIALFLSAAAGSMSAHAGGTKRFALVIGNSAYRHVQSLPNPAGDASAVAETLATLGFDVTEGLDLDREQFEQLISQFRTTAAEAESVVFFYAGHGIQLDGSNHLVPVDAALRNRARINAETLLLDEVIRQLHDPGRQTIVLLDASHNNPLPPSLRDRSRPGLAAVQTGHDIYVSLSAEPGSISLDGRAGNSVFTGALLRHLARPQQSISELMANVSDEVLTVTGGAQVPWARSSLGSQFYFTPGDDGAQLAAEEERVWAHAVRSGRAEDLQSYLAAYPDGRFAAVARNHLAALSATVEGALKPRSGPSILLPGAAANLPKFPWPPPLASAHYTVPNSLVAPSGEPSLNAIAMRIEGALDSAAYYERSYFEVPDGFALVTRLERVREDGRPDQEQRWKAAAHQEFSLLSYIRKLLFAPAGRYRLIVFIVTPHSFALSEDQELSAPQAEELIREGHLRLPAEFDEVHYTDRHRTMALVYEFEKGDEDEVAKLVLPSELQGRDHLERAQIWAALASRPPEPAASTIQQIQ